MSTLSRTVAALGVVLVVVLAPLGAAGEEDTALPCADCHDTVAADFQSNPHATALGRGAAIGAVCAGCHAGGKEHVEAGGDATLISVPRGADAAATCLRCHGGRHGNEIAASGFHAQAGVSCESCHSIHGAKVPRPALLRASASELCVSCHPEVRSAFRKTYTHPMDESVNGNGKGAMQCYSCHNPHGVAGDGNLKRSAALEPACLGCHTEKRGPFVYGHGGVVAGTCRSCHEAHGSANPMMLTRARVAPLCLECHSNLTGTTLGSQPPSLHDLTSPRYQNCTSCHVAVHGSNSSPLLVR